MFKVIIPLLLAGAVNAHAGEPVIVESDSGISVVYDGSATQAEPSRAAAAGATAPVAGAATPPTNPGQLARARFLAAQLQQLDREIRDASRVTGNETDQELAAQRALVADKRASADRFAAEYRQITGAAPPDPAEVAQDTPAAANYNQSPFQKQRNDREERIRNTKSQRRGMGLAPEP